MSPDDSELEVGDGSLSLQFLKQYKAAKNLNSFVSKEVLKTIMSCQLTCGFHLWVRKESSASRVVTITVSSFLAEQEDTQKKTFTCWINSQLAKVRAKVTFSNEDSCGFLTLAALTPGWPMPGIPAPGNWRREDQGFKTSLGYVVNSRPAWAT